MDELQISGKRFISSRRIARENGYTSDYIGQLIRGGKVVGQKVGRAWYVDAVSFDAYIGEDTAPAEILSSPDPVNSADKILQPETLEQISSDVQEFPAPSIFVKEKIIEEPIIEKSERVPLHIITKAKDAGGLRYYAEEAPILPEIYRNRADVKNTAEFFASQTRRASYNTPLLVLAISGIAIFIFSAALSSAVSLNLSIESGNAATTSYSIEW